ncbi:hypothetical protein EDC01DRAFT_126109 [Geopyxis carbonaria]|nr:hypothetical protein EDC01DRAFT_126109 [Geopyxis carbonaria]
MYVQHVQYLLPCFETRLCGAIDGCAFALSVCVVGADRALCEILRSTCCPRTRTRACTPRPPPPPPPTRRQAPTQTPDDARRHGCRVLHDTLHHVAIRVSTTRASAHVDTLDESYPAIGLAHGVRSFVCRATAQSRVPRVELGRTAPAAARARSGIYIPSSPISRATRTASESLPAQVQPHPAPALGTCVTLAPCPSYVLGAFFFFRG